MKSPDTAANTNLQNKRVLVVEDNAINQMLVRHLLIRSQASCIDIAEHGNQALDLMAQRHYDIVLMDIHMPELDGYQTTQVIRTQLKSPIPIIAMTALALKGEDQKCFDAGMDGYLSKPFTLDGLYAEIARVLNNHHNGKVHRLTDGEILVDLTRLPDNHEGKTILQAFTETAPALIDVMQDSFNTGDWETLTNTMHTLQQVLQTVYIPKMEELLDAAQLCLQIRNLSQLALLIANTRVCFFKANNLLMREMGYAKASNKQVA
jgi:CheY-like chemotaxis protein